MMTLFEGNQQILNIYADADKPKRFYSILTTSLVILLIILAIFLGMMGYLAFGDDCKSILLYNLPANETASIVAKVFYIITVMGSYILLIQPIFYVMESSAWYKTLSGQEDEETQ